MKLIEKFTVECDCGFSYTSDREYNVVDRLYFHIKNSRKHKLLYQELEKKGRRLAQSQNGCGYFDSGTDRIDDGWHKAIPSFRTAWQENALKEMFG